MWWVGESPVGRIQTRDRWTWKTEAMTPGKMLMVAASSLVVGSVSCAVSDWVMTLEKTHCDAGGSGTPLAQVEEERRHLQDSVPLQLVIELQRRWGFGLMHMYHRYLFIYM